MPRVLIVEDESSIAESLLFVLQAEGFATHWETLATKGLEYIQQHPVDLVIMDVGLPDITGFEACKQLRRFSEVPLIFLTARGEELDRVVGLEIGADDYVVKPFSPREVAARVKVILKRRITTNAESSTQQKSVNQEFDVDEQRKVIYFFGALLSLTKLEYQLLEYLIKRPDHVLSREQLLQAVGIANDANYDRSIDTHIKTIRSKLRQINEEADPIKTQRGFGYFYQPS
ncbi:MAG: two-component system response regulator CreB [Cellvibrio sp.]|nr:two-component system response regulator CreB [Cellvibrio sp.]